MKNLTKGVKWYLFFLVILSFVFGRGFYLLLILTVIYTVVYSVTFRKYLLKLRTQINTHTIHQNDIFSLSYQLNFGFKLPVLVSVNISFPHYIVLNQGEKNIKVFSRNQKMEKVILCKGNKRGTYSVGKFIVDISDPLGFFKLEKLLIDAKKIFVFPFLIPIEKLKIHLSEPIEGIKAKYQLNRDYTYVAGVRDYTFEDPVSMIHWKQSAHKGKLSVKEFDFSASKKIVIALNLFGKNTAFEDYASAIAASICYYAFKFHLPFGVIIGSKDILYSGVGNSEFHLAQVFKDLSMTHKETLSTEKFLSKINHYVPFGAELFYIDKDVDFKAMLAIMGIKPFLAKINVVLLPDNIFVLPSEKPPMYFFKETEYLKVLKNSKEALAKEGINVYPILGKDYLSLLEA